MNKLEFSLSQSFKANLFYKDHVRTYCFVTVKKRLISVIHYATVTNLRDSYLKSDKSAYCYKNFRNIKLIRAYALYTACEIIDIQLVKVK